MFSSQTLRFCPRQGGSWSCLCLSTCMQPVQWVPASVFTIAEASEQELRHVRCVEAGAVKRCVTVAAWQVAQCCWNVNSQCVQSELFLAIPSSCGIEHGFSLTVLSSCMKTVKLEANDVFSCWEWLELRQLEWKVLMQLNWTSKWCPTEQGGTKVKSPHLNKCQGKD